MAAEGGGKVEELSVALVREYLSKKGYRSTLASLDNEAPRTEHSISNRSLLTRDLGINHLIKRNKGLPRPFKTTIEVLVNYFVTTPTSSISSVSPSKRDTPLDGNPITVTSLPAAAGRPGNPSKLRETSKKRSMQLEELTGDHHISHEVTKAQQVLQGMTRSALIDNMTTKSHQSHDKSNPVTEGSHLEPFLWEDLEDVNSYIEDSKPLKVQSPIIRSVGDVISSSTAQKLREVVFGSATGPSFNEEWRSQGFVFNTIPNLSYGLVQYKGGPCGVLACVQAYILKSLLFADEATSITTINAIPQLSVSVQKELLVTALTEILWKVGEKERANVALKPWQRLNKMSPMKSKSYWPDQLTEQLVVHSFSDYDSLKQFINHHLSQFSSTNKDNAGCIVFLYSVILTRGLDKLQTDFDDPHSTLIGAHGYCTQELVNLFLTGAGTSNAFDGDIVIDSSSTLKGLKCQNQIGYLTLFEYYGNCQIGEYYKSPKFPIWVICSESHFTVLFSLSMDIVNESISLSKFQLYYYDGLYNMTESVILTIDTSSATATGTFSDDLLQPLDLCIMTKWKKAVVDYTHDGLAYGQI